MNIKTIVAYTEKAFDRKMNEFISDPSIEVVEIQYSATIFLFTAMIVYK